MSLVNQVITSEPSEVETVTPSDVSSGPDELQGKAPNRRASTFLNSGPLNFVTNKFIGRRKKEELNKNDMIIAVMGPTGSGKSTFIKMASGVEDIVGHSLQSCTTDITSYEVVLDVGVCDISITFVDTPGFDDTTKPDTEILRLISNWLKETYNNQARLTGILYFHRITDNRMAGTPLKNLKMFQKVCGNEALSRVALTTTMWDEVDVSIGEEREGELIKEYWGPMINSGSHTARFHGSVESVYEIIQPFLFRSDGVLDTMQRSTLLLQDEIVEQSRLLAETQAGRTLYTELEVQVVHQQRILTQMKENMGATKMTAAETRQLMDEYERTRSMVSQTLDEMRQLDITTPNIARRIQKIFTTDNRLGRFLKRRSTVQIV